MGSEALPVLAVVRASIQRCDLQPSDAKSIRLGLFHFLGQADGDGMGTTSVQRIDLSLDGERRSVIPRFDRYSRYARE